MSIVDADHYLFTSESVTEGHPDTAADQGSGAILDATLAQHPFGRVACETLGTTALALTAAETGNLVISTMATQSAAQTVTRIIDPFPPHQQAQARSQLSLTLRAVVSQVLLPRADGHGQFAGQA